jgi:hypothetical protein
MYRGMKGAIEHFRKEVLPNWRVYAMAFGLSTAWQNCQAPAQPATPAYVSEEAELLGTAAKWALGAYVAYEVLND